MNDPILEEIRRIREEYAARFNYDLDAIFEDIRKHEERSGRTFIRLPPRRVVKQPLPEPTHIVEDKTNEQPQSR